MDTYDAVWRFQSQADAFSQLLFVTDADVTELFGEPVSAALDTLARFGAETHICADCGGTCCRDIGCELYAAAFGHCPIHAFRPLVCRFHFCYRFDVAGRSLVIGLRDVFLASFMALAHAGSDKLTWLDTPPLTPAAAGFVAAISPLVEGVRASRRDPEAAERLLLQYVRDTRESPQAARDHSEV